MVLFNMNETLLHFPFGNARWSVYFRSTHPAHRWYVCTSTHTQVGTWRPSIQRTWCIRGGVQLEVLLKRPIKMWLFHQGSTHQPSYYWHGGRWPTLFPLNAALCAQSVFSYSWWLSVQDIWLFAVSRQDRAAACGAKITVRYNFALLPVVFLH